VRRFAGNWANSAPWRTAKVVCASRRSGWLVPIVVLLATSSCDQRREKPELPPLAKLAGSSESAPPLRDRVAYELYRVRQRFVPPPGPLERVRQHCPDPTIHQHSPDDASRTLVLRQVDHRVESRQLLPLRITDQLRTHELDELGRHFETGRDSGGERDADRLLGELGRAGQHRYLGIYHVTEYAGPQLVLRVGELRRKWEPGSLHAWLVIYDLEAKQRLCAFELGVRSDPRDAPTSSRLRSETRQRLEVELGRSLARQARERLALATSELHWPATDGHETD
jgi:hypothetical protein